MGILQYISYCCLLISCSGSKIEWQLQSAESNKSRYKNDNIFIDEFNDNTFLHNNDQYHHTLQQSEKEIATSPIPIQLSNCSSSQYADLQTKNCHDCNIECNACSGPNANQCTQCDNSLNQQYLLDGACVKQCGDKTYSITSEDEYLQCGHCYPSCLTCYGNASNNCLSCQELTHIFENGFCQELCFTRLPLCKICSEDLRNDSSTYGKLLCSKCENSYFVKEQEQCVPFNTYSLHNSTFTIEAMLDSAFNLTLEAVAVDISIDGKQLYQGTDFSLTYRAVFEPDSQPAYILTHSPFYLPQIDQGISSANAQAQVETPPSIRMFQEKQQQQVNASQSNQTHNNITTTSTNTNQIMFYQQEVANNDYTKFNCLIYINLMRASQFLNMNSVIKVTFSDDFDALTQMQTQEAKGQNTQNRRNLQSVNMNITQCNPCVNTQVQLIEARQFNMNGAGRCRATIIHAVLTLGRNNKQFNLIFRDALGALAPVLNEVIYVSIDNMSSKDFRYMTYQYSEKNYILNLKISGPIVGSPRMRVTFNIPQVLQELCSIKVETSKLSVTLEDDYLLSSAALQNVQQSAQVSSIFNVLLLLFMIIDAFVSANTSVNIRGVMLCNTYYTLKFIYVSHPQNTATMMHHQKDFEAILFPNVPMQQIQDEDLDIMPDKFVEYGSSFYIIDNLSQLLVFLGMLAAWGLLLKVTSKMVSKKHAELNLRKTQMTQMRKNQRNQIGFLLTLFFLNVRIFVLFFLNKCHSFFVWDFCILMIMGKYQKICTFVLISVRVPIIHSLQGKINFLIAICLVPFLMLLPRLFGKSNAMMEEYTIAQKKKNIKVEEFKQHKLKQINLDLALHAQITHIEKHQLKQIDLQIIKPETNNEKGRIEDNNNNGNLETPDLNTRKVRALYRKEQQGEIQENDESVFPFYDPRPKSMRQQLSKYQKSHNNQSQNTTNMEATTLELTNQLLLNENIDELKDNQNENSDALNEAKIALSEQVSQDDDDMNLELQQKKQFNNDNDKNDNKQINENYMGDDNKQLILQSHQVEVLNYTFQHQEEQTQTQNANIANDQQDGMQLIKINDDNEVAGQIINTNVAQDQAAQNVQTAKEFLEKQTSDFSSGGRFDKLVAKQPPSKPQSIVQRNSDSSPLENADHQMKPNNNEIVNRFQKDTISRQRRISDVQPIQYNRFGKQQDSSSLEEQQSLPKQEQTLAQQEQQTYKPIRSTTRKFTRRNTQMEDQLSQQNQKQAQEEQKLQQQTQQTRVAQRMKSLVQQGGGSGLAGSRFTFRSRTIIAHPNAQQQLVQKIQIDSSKEKEEADKSSKHSIQGSEGSEANASQQQQKLTPESNPFKNIYVEGVDAKEFIEKRRQNKRAVTMAFKKSSTNNEEEEEYDKERRQPKSTYLEDGLRSHRKVGRKMTYREEQITRQRKAKLVETSDFNESDVSSHESKQQSYTDLPKKKVKIQQQQMKTIPLHNVNPQEFIKSSTDKTKVLQWTQMLLQKKQPNLPMRVPRFAQPQISLKQLLAQARRIKDLKLQSLSQQEKDDREKREHHWRKWLQSHNKPSSKDNLEEMEQEQEMLMEVLSGEEDQEGYIKKKEKEYQDWSGSPKRGGYFSMQQFLIEQEVNKMDLNADESNNDENSDINSQARQGESINMTKLRPALIPLINPKLASLDVVSEFVQEEDIKSSIFNEFASYSALRRQKKKGLQPYVNSSLKPPSPRNLYAAIPSNIQPSYSIKQFDADEYKFKSAFNSRNGILRFKYAMHLMYYYSKFIVLLPWRYIHYTFKCLYPMYKNPYLYCKFVITEKSNYIMLDLSRHCLVQACIILLYASAMVVIFLIFFIHVLFIIYLCKIRPFEDKHNFIVTVIFEGIFLTEILYCFIILRLDQTMDQDTAKRMFIGWLQIFTILALYMVLMLNNVFFFRNLYRKIKHQKIDHNHAVAHIKDYTTKIKKFKSQIFTDQQPQQQQQQQQQTILDKNEKTTLTEDNLITLKTENSYLMPLEGGLKMTQWKKKHKANQIIPSLAESDQANILNSTSITPNVTDRIQEQQFFLQQQQK